MSLPPRRSRSLLSQAGHGPGSPIMMTITLNKQQSYQERLTFKIKEFICQITK